MQKRAYDKKSGKEFIDPEIFETNIGIDYIKQGEEFIAYLSNIKAHSTSEDQVTDKASQTSCLLLFFYLERPDDRGNVLKKCVFKYEPYFYIIIKPDIIEEFQQYVSKRFEGKIASTEIIEKVDLNMVNHLSGIKKKVLKVNFKNVANLVHVRNILRPYVQKNKMKEKVLTYSELLNPSVKVDLIEMIQELREDDIPYHVRVCIDNEIRCGFWYEVSSNENGCKLVQLASKLNKCPLTVLAFDIETTKAPLKFPDPKIDSIMLISYMIDGDGYLITNRSIISEEIEDFQYPPKLEFEGFFHIFNEANEEELLKRFVLHCKERRPNIFVTFNGDYFDIPFIDERMKVYGMSMESLLGIANTVASVKAGEGEYMGRFSVHIDCFYWVKRDAFLPQGSHGLKAVTKAKLGYDPIEVDPEEMLPMAQNNPKKFCEYSVSDALATYYLYRLMIHDFIYALCTIIPTNPDEVLRKGSGTLCEELLMAQAFRRNIVFPEKQVEEFEKFYQGHLIDSETYIGGHVECLNVGVYRSDIATTFKLDPAAYDYLADNIDQYLKFTLEIENKQDGGLESIVNYTQVVEDIKSRLRAIRDLASAAIKNEIDLTPLIYHLDVGAMYPNIILTNKLQPVSMVNEQICAGCLHNRDDSNCKRYMKWSWKGELFPLSRSEYENLKQQYEWELLGDDKDIEDLEVEDHRKNFIKRIKNYCSKVYKQVHLKKVELKEGVVCMKENSFYVDTIRDFRDRRYEFKFLVKKWKGKMDEAKAAKNIEEVQNAKNMMELYESLQLAHKIILNSFYGYVMRKGSRWFSMEMAAMVTHLGSNLITDARQFCEKIGKPLELDTDGIWCCLPKGFPEVYQLQLSSGKKLNYSFPCTMLNALIFDKYSNPQFAYPDDKCNWALRNEMSIFFEVDGPYRCMVLPAAKEEGKMLKKRYAVFGLDGKITELKGFELKRRGELKIIKIFQAEVFGNFLKGTNLTECYAACAEIANRWYSILEAEGRGINDEELIEYIEESRMMSKSLAEYGTQKSTAITCAKRLAELTSNSALLKDKGLCTKFIISKKPPETPIAERAIPTAVFRFLSSQMSNGSIDSSDKIKKRNLLRKWLRDSTLEDVDMRDVIDWNYYKERLASNILKILIIPAALQQVGNPYPNIPYPDWVHKLMLRKENIQKSLNLFFNTVSNVDRMISVTEDMEKMNITRAPKKKKEQPQAKKVNLDKYLTENYAVKAQSVEKDIEENIGETINIADDFDNWLSQQKKKWKNCLNKKRQAKSALTTESHMASLKSQAYSNLENDFKKSPLRILQVIEDPSYNGNLQVWVAFNRQMAKIAVSIKRKIFINSIKQNVPNFTLTQMSLPRNKPVLNLYEVDVEEKVFREKLNNFNDYIINPSIEGVYETKIPLVFQLIKEYGCIVKYNNKRKGASLASSFLFEDFDSMPDDGISPYDSLLEPGKIFLYHSNLGGRHFLAVFIFPLHKAYVYVINPMNKNIDVPNVKKVMMTCFAKDYAEFASSVEFEFEVTTTVERDIRVALNSLNKLLVDIRTSSLIQGSIIVLFQSCFTTKKMIELGLICLFNHYPVMQIPFNAEENDYPALDWIKFAIKKVALRYIDLSSIYDFRCQLGRYCGVPICNLDFDPMIYCADFVFSRLLKASKQVLWYSPNGFPDLGGGDMTQDFLGELECQFPKVNNPAMYLGYSAEVDIGLFCVNAILESDHMKDFSGKYELSSMERTQKTAHPQHHQSLAVEEYKKQMEQYRLERDEYALSSNAFIVLKKMVEKWLNDIRVYESPCADYLLVHFYRWISSYNSKFYDPVIYRMINLLMQKYFSILIRKVTDFGFDIIYADNKKLFLFNNKSSLNDFNASIDYLFRSIKKIPIFNHLILTPNNCWKMLLFKDLHNFSGVSANEDEGELSSAPKIISNWTLSEYLPPILEKDFISLLSDYITKLYRYFYLKDVDMIINLYSAYQNTVYTSGEAKAMMEGDGAIQSFKHFLIADYLSTKIFNIIPNILFKRKYEYDNDEDIDVDANDNAVDNNNNNEAPLFTREDFIDDQDSYDEAEGEDVSTFKQIQPIKKAQFRKGKAQWEFPLKLGTSGTKRGNLAIEYINYVCEILEVDSQIRSQSMVLKKNCLRLINIEEYSKETYFTDPCRTFTLRDVLCEFCSTNKDIDFCRDESILSQKWTCEHCNSHYDKDLIEFRVIKKVQNVINYYYNQDLQCHKCKNQKDDYLFPLCSCAGDYHKTFEESFQRDYPNMKTIRDLIQTLQDISHYYQFNYLKALLNDYK